MSKLIELYKSLKSTNSNKLYLFKSGIFYIFLDEDAKIMNNVFNFKLTNLNSEYVKCGFPGNSFDKYMNLIQQLNYDVEIVEPNNNIPYPIKNHLEHLAINDLLSKIISIDIDSLSISEVYSYLSKIQEESRKIMEVTNGK